MEEETGVSEEEVEQDGVEEETGVSEELEIGDRPSVVEESGVDGGGFMEEVEAEELSPGQWTCFMTGETTKE